MHAIRGVDIAIAPGETIAELLLALVSGNWFSLGDGTLRDVAQVLPSYWLVQAGHVALGGAAWNATGWLVVAAWTLVLGALAWVAFRRDTERV